MSCFEGGDMYVVDQDSVPENIYFRSFTHCTCRHSSSIKLHSILHYLSLFQYGLEKSGKNREHNNRNFPFLFPYVTLYQSIKSCCGFYR